MLRRGSDATIHVSVKCVQLEDPGEAIDTSNKIYTRDEICGFKINYEPGVFGEFPDLLPELEADLGEVMLIFELLRSYIPQTFFY